MGFSVSKWYALGKFMDVQIANHVAVSCIPECIAWKLGCSCRYLKENTSNFRSLDVTFMLYLSGNGIYKKVISIWHLNKRIKFGTSAYLVDQGALPDWRHAMKACRDDVLTSLAASIRRFMYLTSEHCEFFLWSSYAILVGPTISP